MTDTPLNWVGYGPVGTPRSAKLDIPARDPITARLNQILELVLRFLRGTDLDPALAALIAPGQIFMRTVEKAQVQAMTVQRNGKPVIIVNRGLALFLYRIARAFSPQVIVRGPGDPPAPSMDESAGLMASSVLDWMASPVRAPLISADWPVSDREKRTAENFTTAAERFVICHELGHVLLRDKIAELPDGDVPQMELESFDTRAVTEELMADRWATRMVVDSMTAGGFDVRAAAVGVHYFLETLEAAEMVGAIAADNAHPPARDRLLTCHEALEERFGERFGYVQSWAAELNQLLAQLWGKAYVWRDLGYKMARGRMDRILATTPWPVPDRAASVTVDPIATMDHFVRDSPSGVLDAIAANLLDTDAYARRVPPKPADAVRDDAWRRHQLACFLALRTPEQVQGVLGLDTIGAPR